MCVPGCTLTNCASPRNAYYLGYGHVTVLMSRVHVIYGNGSPAWAGACSRLSRFHVRCGLSDDVKSAPKKASSKGPRESFSRCHSIILCGSCLTAYLHTQDSRHPVRTALLRSSNIRHGVVSAVCPMSAILNLHDEVLLFQSRDMSERATRATKGPCASPQF